MAVWGGLTNSYERREVKNKGEKERYKHLTAEFQRVARRDKKALFSDQWKERDGKNRMGKTRDLFKKIRDTKGTFHAKMGSISWRRLNIWISQQGLYFLIWINSFRIRSCYVLICHKRK